MRISVTGADGFLGTKLINLLVQEGHYVIAWVRNPTVHPSIDYRQFTLEQANKIDLTDSDVLVHCAAYLPHNYEDISETKKCLMNNGLATLELLQVSEKYNLKSFIHLSSGQIYSWKDPVSEALETEKIDPIERAVPYLASKLLGDLYVRSHKGKIRTIVLRPSHIYGPGMKPKGLLHRIINSINQSDTVDMNKIGNYNVDLVYADDVVNMINLVCCKEYTHSVYNVGGGQAISTSNLVQLLAKIMDKSIDIKNIGYDYKLDRGHPILNIQRAKDSGYYPTDLMVGLKELCGVFK